MRDRTWLHPARAQPLAGGAAIKRERALVGFASGDQRLPQRADLTRVVHVLLQPRRRNNGRLGVPERVHMALHPVPQPTKLPFEPSERRVRRRVAACPRRRLLKRVGKPQQACPGSR